MVNWGSKHKKGYKMLVSDAKRMLREELDKHELYHVEVKMNGRLTSAFGRYKWHRLSNYKVVELSTKLVEINDADRVKLTILHEVAHALTEGHGHDRVWRDTLLRIGGDGKRCYSSTDTNTIERAISTKQYQLQCVKCDYRGMRRYRRRMTGYMQRGCGGNLENVEVL